MIFEKLPRIKHIRDDGWLCELISTKYHDQPFSDIHSYIVSIVPHQTRAKHYHKRKEEWIAQAAGEIEITLENIHTKETGKIMLDTKTKDYSIIHIPPFIAHSIKNTGDYEASIIVFSKTPEDKTDTIPYEVKV
jgi:oxalate decarboxylase/phosphoglucose isomerase-like protein (cupin superfamily)